MNRQSKYILLIFLFYQNIFICKYYVLMNKYNQIIILKNINKRNNNKIIKKITVNHIYINKSRDYWEKRYAEGGNSGAGSYNKYAEFKASIINNFVKINNVNTVIEWGSGDCNQLSLSNYKNYIGYDVSQTAIEVCKKKFYNDTTKTFIYLKENFTNIRKADLSISLDVIYHLFENNVFDLYMRNLFNSSDKYIIIYSTNFEERRENHIKHRKFTDWIDKYMSKNWKIKKYIPNIYRSKASCDFFIYEKINHKIN